MANLLKYLTKEPKTNQEKASSFHTGAKFKQAKCMAQIPINHNGEISIGLLTKVGLPTFAPKSSSTKKAVAFASIVKYPSTSSDDRGSWRGAVRHVLWQSDITANYSPEIAQSIGNCHETGYAPNTNRTYFSKLDDADSTVDQLNNVIGREIGSKHKYLSTKERMLEVLKRAYTDGLYIVKKNPFGSYEVSKERIDAATFARFYNETLQRDEYGEIPDK